MTKIAMVFLVFMMIDPAVVKADWLNLSNGASIEFKWKDGSTIWYSATRNDREEIERYNRCVPDGASGFNFAEVEKGDCYLEPTGKWAVELKTKLIDLSEKQRLLPPDKRLSPQGFEKARADLFGQYSGKCPGGFVLQGGLASGQGANVPVCRGPLSSRGSCKNGFESAKAPVKNGVNLGWCYKYKPCPAGQVAKINPNGTYPGCLECRDGGSLDQAKTEHDKDGYGYEYCKLDIRELEKPKNTKNESSKSRVPARSSGAKAKLKKDTREQPTEEEHEPETDQEDGYGYPN